MSKRQKSAIPRNSRLEGDRLEQSNDVTLVNQTLADTAPAREHGDAGHHDCIEDKVNEAASRCEGAMQPVVVGGCFGWLHRGMANTGRGVAVLICPPLYRDALDSYHSLRLLADDFAAAGYPTLRFNYPGTGDSCDAESPDLWPAWQQSLRHAADWLRTVTGARQLVLCGLRIGATLAALAAASRDDVAGLILLAPVLRGRSYIRQLLIEAQLQDQTVAPTESDLGLDFHELYFSSETIRQINQVDLRKVEFHADLAIAVFSTTPAGIVSDCAESWTRQGCRVSSKDFTGLEPALQPNLRVKEAPADFSAVTGWLQQTVPQRPNQLAGIDLAGPTVLHTPAATEVPLHFGPAPGLFGILSRPAQPADTTAVIITNAGRDPHYGSARFGVEFARRLAAAGVAALRMDFEGLGDSPGLLGREKILSPLFEADRSPDISAAIDLLEQQGYTKFVVYGLCSGAYHAFHSGLADPRISVMLLVNMPVFVWRSGDTIDLVRHKTSPYHYYLLRLLKKEFWKQILKGRLDLANIIQARRQRIRENMKARTRHLLERLGYVDLKSFPRRAMATLAGRETRTLFVFAPDDGGIDAVEQEFGRGGSGLGAFNATMHVVPGLDHMLSGRAMRQTAADLMIGYLRGGPPSCR